MKLEIKNSGNSRFVYFGHLLLSSIELADDSSNCKLSYIHRVGCLNSFPDKEKKEIIDFALIYSKGCVIINTINKKVALFIKKNYPTYYYQEVPIGYYNGFQYHICIKNSINPNAYCKYPIKEKNKKGLTKTKVEKTLRKVLKSKKLSTRFVNEFIRELEKNKE